MHGMVRIWANYQVRNRADMRILQKATVRTSNSSVVLSNLKDVPDCHQSKMKRNLHHGSGIIHPNYNSNEQILYTIPVIVSGDVQTKDRVKVINRNAFDTEHSAHGATTTTRKGKKNVPLNVR
jgi:hypothetical protein